jgi:hypothetical protein
MKLQTLPEGLLINIFLFTNEFDLLILVCKQFKDIVYKYFKLECVCITIDKFQWYNFEYSFKINLSKNSTFCVLKYIVGSILSINPQDFDFIETNDIDIWRNRKESKIRGNTNLMKFIDNPFILINIKSTGLCNDYRKCVTLNKKILPINKRFNIIFLKQNIEFYEDLLNNKYKFSTNIRSHIYKVLYYGYSNFYPNKNNS